MTIPLYESEESKERSKGRPTEAEINEYHDFIEEMMKDKKFWNRLNAPTQQAMLICRDCLCFVLGHENESMRINIQTWANGYMQHQGVDSSYPN